MATEGPTEDELAKAKAYLKGSYALELRHLDQDRQPSCCRIQLDDLGIDYIEKRNGLMDAVTRGHPPRRQASGRRRPAGHGGRPAQGIVLEGAGRLIVVRRP